MRDSKSSRKAGGQPPSPEDSSNAKEDEKLLDEDSGGVLGTGLKGEGRVVADGVVGGVVWLAAEADSLVYEQPRHHTGLLRERSLVGPA